MLINQSEGRGNSPLSSPKEKPMADPKKVVPTYGYDAETGEPQLFELKEGEKLPEGFVDNPAKSKAAKADAKAAKAK